MTRLPDITPDDAADLAGRPDVCLVDVRTAAEWAAGHAHDAIHVPLDRLTGQEIATDRLVLTICHSGRRSAIAANRLADTHQVRNVLGGMADWQEQELRVVNTGQPGQTSA